MTATNTNVNVVNVGSQIGSNKNGYKFGFIDSGAKAAQNDTWTIKNINQLVAVVCATLDATGAAEPFTVSGNIITLTGATGTSCSALVIYK